MTDATATDANHLVPLADDHLVVTRPLGNREVRRDRAVRAN